MKKIIFLPFINDPDGQADGGSWRKEKESVFLNEKDVKTLTEEINQRRNQNPNADNDAAYYRRLHEKKSERQNEWLKRLTAETAALFENKLGTLPDEAKDPEKSIIVAALPEFFWCDINDNNKHETRNPAKNGEYIEGYHKPLYDTNMINNLLHAENNPLAKLTKTYPNLIIFGGTAMWKIINEEDHKDEKVNNTLIIYHTGDVANTWSKCFFSDIDGFDSESKEMKKGEFGVIDENGNLQTNCVPFTEFRGVKFTYDICLDFIAGENGQPLSTDLCSGQETHVNVLISAGMPIDDKDLAKINSPVILRCDGSYPPYAETASNGVYIADDLHSISGGTIIGKLETEINI